MTFVCSDAPPTSAAERADLPRLPADGAVAQTRPPPQCRASAAPSNVQCAGKLGFWQGQQQAERQVFTFSFTWLKMEP